MSRSEFVPRQYMIVNYIFMQAVNSYGRKVWSEKMVSYCYDAERKDWEAVQREMA